MEEGRSQKKQTRIFRQLSPSAHYSVEKLFRNTTQVSVSPFRGSSPMTKKPSKTSHSHLSAITRQMDNRQQLMEHFMRQSHYKMNQSFSGYFLKEAGVRQEQLRRKKVTKKKKVQDKREKMVELPRVEGEQSVYQDTNIKLTALPNKCYDSMFPNIRYSPALVAHERNVYLIGGYHEQFNEGISLFHRYDYDNQKWVQVRSQGQTPQLDCSFHTIQLFRNHLVLIGGISLEGEKGDRFQTELMMFNLEKAEWSKVRTGIALKHHASTVFGSTLMVSGGINEKLRYSQEIYFITFSGNSLTSPLHLTIRHSSDIVDHVAHHQIINTYQMEMPHRNLLVLDGIFSFGGQDEQGRLNNHLLFMNVMGKNNQNLDIKFKKWELVATNDDKPVPRKDHSLSVLNKKGLAVLVGGVDQWGDFLSDIWMLDLMRMQWRRINSQPKIERALGSLYGHCACSWGSSLYIYNGHVKRKIERAFWQLQFDPSPFRTKKSLYSTKLPTFKTIKSQKQNTSMAQI